MMHHHTNQAQRTKNSQSIYRNQNKPKPSAIAMAVRASILTFGLASGSAQTANINVTSALDDNGVGCTLREALESVNTQVFQGGCVSPDGSSLGTDDIINLDAIPGDTITLVMVN